MRGMGNGEWQVQLPFPIPFIPLIPAYPLLRLNNTADTASISTGGIM